MPGITGYTSQEKVNPKLLDAMTAAMLHRPNYSVSQVTDKHFSIASIDLEQNRQKDSAESQDGRYVLVFFGRLYESWVNSQGKIASKLLEKWLSGGWKSLADLNGDYLIVVWDRHEERLTIVNDRLGLRRLHYWWGNGTFAFASEVKSLAVIAEVSRVIDEHALSELLIFGHLQDDRTLLRDVTLLAPASYLTWCKGKLSIDQYWQFQHQADQTLEDEKSVLDQYAFYVRQAVQRRVNGNQAVGLFLSGGYDSRTVAGMVRKVMPKGVISTYTTGHGHDHDSRYAKRIAQAMGSEHCSIQIPKSFLQDLASDYTWILDGSVTADGCHRGVLNEIVGDQEIPFFNGFLGDVLSGGKPLDQMFHIVEVGKLIEAGYRHYAHGFDETTLKQILRPQVYSRIRGLARESFAQSVRNAQVEHPGDRVVQAELYEREQRGNPRVQVDYLNASCQVVTPFTDRDFVDFALRLPVKQRVGRLAYERMICREFPKLARVPKSGDGLPIVHSRLRASIHWRWVLFKRNTLPQLTGGLWRGHNYTTFVHCDEWFKNSSRQFIEETLINNPILEEHFQMEPLNKLVRHYLNDPASTCSYVGIASLISFVVFRKRLNQLSTCEGRIEPVCAVS